jgi:Arc/MetJ-type ribon-helix-helix transcriptional regulator
MSDEKTVTLKLNQQQLELIDRTLARGIAPDRAALVRLALRELAASRGVDAASSPEARPTGARS